MVNVEELLQKNERLRIVDQVAKQIRFHHWEMRFADLFAEIRRPVQKLTTELDRASVLALNDHEYLETFLDKLPDKYRALNRQAIYGDFFSFYLCDVVLKLNGKGGQPVYVKVVGQDTGRCTPR